MNSASRPAAMAHVGLVLVMVFWGLMVPGLYVLLETWGAFALTALRYIVAVPMILALLWWWEGSARLPPVAHWPRLALLGTVGITGLGVLFTLGIEYSDPVTAIVLQSASPVIQVVAARAIFGVPLERGIVPALVLALAGSLLTVWPRLQGASAGIRGGEILVVLGSCCWAWYSIACQRWLPGYSQPRIAAFTIVGGAVMLWIATPFAPLAGVSLQAAATPGVVPIALLVSVTLTSTCLGVLFWHVGVVQLGLPIASLYLNLIPVVGVLFTMVAGVMPSWEQVVGGLIVIIGVMQVQLWRRRDPAPR